MSVYNPIVYASLGRKAREIVQRAEIDKAAESPDSTNENSVHAAGLAGMLARLATFRPSFCCVHAVDVPAAACQGWIVGEAEHGSPLLTCVQCGAKVAAAAASARPVAPAADEHKQSCLFRYVAPPCATSPWYLPVDSDLLAHFNDSIQVGAGGGRRVIDALADELCVADEVRQWSDDPLRVLAVHGWRVSCSGSGKIFCSLCCESVSEKRRVFDAVAEHRVFCPWATGRFGLEAAWRRLLAVLSDKKRSARDLHGDTPARKVARILGGDDGSV